MGFLKTITGVLALSLTASADVLWQNPGLVADCDSVSLEHEGTIGDVTNVVYKGDTAIKVTQTYDSSYSGRYHSECVHNDGYKLGETRFYGFAFRLSESWEFDQQSYNLAQWIADFTDTGCDDWMPSSMIWIVGDQLYTRVKYGTVCDQHISTYSNLATVTAGDWHRVVVQADWQSDGTGYYKLWFDGVKVTENYNIATTVPDSRLFSFRVGLYANGWHDQGKLVGSQSFRQVWYDNIAIGTAYADVDPSQWQKREVHALPFEA